MKRTQFLFFFTGFTFLGCDPKPATAEKNCIKKHYTKNK
jgi:hypothetical protein